MLLITLLALLPVFLLLALFCWGAFTFKQTILCAIAETKEALFSPFRLEVWFQIALPAWLANLGRNNLGTGISTHSKQTEAFLRHGVTPEIQLWCMNHWQLLCGIGFAVFILFALILLLICWLRARGLFVLTDIIESGYDTEALSVRFKKWKERSNSFMLVQYIFVVCYIVFLFLWLALSGWLILKSVFSPILFIFLCGVLGILTLAFSIIYILYEDFGSMMMKKEQSLSGKQALELLLKEIRKRSGFYFRYLLTLGFIYIVFTFGLSFLLIITCCGCCLGLMLLMTPYLWAVLLLPFLYFRRSFTIECFRTIQQ